jgi:hypothetical protein
MTHDNTRDPSSTRTHLPCSMGHRRAARPTAMEMMEKMRERQRRLLGDESRLNPHRDALVVLDALKTFGTGPKTTFIRCDEVEARLAVPIPHWPAVQAWVLLHTFGLVGFMTWDGRSYARLPDAIDRLVMARSGEPIRSVQWE